MIEQVPQDEEFLRQHKAGTLLLWLILVPSIIIVGGYCLSILALFGAKG